MQFRCERCGATVGIQDDTQSLNCPDCGTELVVHRHHGTIALKMKVAEQDSSKAARFVPELVEKLTAELTELNAELVRIRRRRIVVAVVGGCCALIFATFAISALLSHDTNIGLTMLLCGGGCSWFVLFVQRDEAAASTEIGSKVADVKHCIAKNQRVCFAAKKGIHRVVVDLYLREIKYYPAWIQHSRSHVPSRVTAAVRLDTDSVRLTIGGSEYLFTLAYEHRNTEHAKVVLNVFVDDAMVLSAGGDILENQLTTHISSHYINMIVDGAWIEELFALWAEGRGISSCAKNT
jgi:DNA-directed RNA polymerase subunit RPC12/RpoP